MGSRRRTQHQPPARGRRALAGLVLATGLAAPVEARDEAPTLTACASHTPPFVLIQGGEAVGGFSVELLRALGARLGHAVRVLDRPWARCLLEVQHGRIDLAVDAYEDAERRTRFHYTRAYHQLTPQVYQRRSRLLPEAERSPDTLRSLKGCGVLGYTYAHYGLDAATLDRNASDDRQLIQRLRAGHCDYALEEMEFIIGAMNTQKDWPPMHELQSFQPAWAERPRLYLLVSRANFTGPELVRRLDEAIHALERDGTLARLRRQHLELPLQARQP